MTTRNKADQAILISTNPDDAFVVKIVNIQDTFQEFPELQNIGLLKASAYRLLIAPGKFLEHRLISVIRHDAFSKNFYPQHSRKTTFQDLIWHYHDIQPISQLPLLIDALSSAFRLGKLQHATIAGLAIEKERATGAEFVTSIAMNPQFDIQDLFMLVDGIADSLTYQPELLKRDVAAVIQFITPIFPRLQQVLDMEDFDANPETYIRLIPTGTKSAVAIKIYPGSTIELPLYAVEGLGMLRKQNADEVASKTSSETRQVYVVTFTHDLPKGRNQAFVLTGPTLLETSGFNCQTYHYMIALQLQVILVARMIPWLYKASNQNKNQQRDNIQTLMLPAILVFALNHEDVPLIQAHFGIIGPKLQQGYVEPPPLRMLELSPRRHLQIGMFPESHNLHKYSPRLSAPGFLLTNVAPKFYYLLRTMHRNQELVDWLEELRVVAASVGPHYDETTRKISLDLISFVFITERQLTYLPTPPRCLNHIAGTSGGLQTAIKTRLFLKDASLFPKRIAPLYLGMDDKNSKLGPAAGTLNQQDINKAINALGSETRERAKVSSTRYRPSYSTQSNSKNSRTYASASQFSSSSSEVKRQVTGYRAFEGDNDSDDQDEDDEPRVQTLDFETPPRRQYASKGSDLFGDSPMQLSQASSNSGSSVSAATSCTASQPGRRGPPPAQVRHMHGLDAKLTSIFSPSPRITENPASSEQAPGVVVNTPLPTPTQDLAAVLALLSNPATLAAVMQVLSIQQAPPVSNSSQPTSSSTVLPLVPTVAPRDDTGVVSKQGNRETPNGDNDQSVELDSQTVSKDIPVTDANLPVNAISAFSTSVGPHVPSQDNSASPTEDMKVLPVASAFLTQAASSSPEGEILQNERVVPLQRAPTTATVETRASLPRQAKLLKESSNQQGGQPFHHPNNSTCPEPTISGGSRASSQSVISTGTSAQSQLLPLLQRDQHHNKVTVELIHSEIKPGDKAKKKKNKVTDESPDNSAMDADTSGDN